MMLGHDRLIRRGRLALFGNELNILTLNMLEKIVSTVSFIGKKINFVWNAHVECECLKKNHLASIARADFIKKKINK